MRIQTISHIVTLAFACITGAFAQNPSQIVLNQADNGNKTYIARERVILKPGYSYSTITTANKMLAQIDETQVFNVSYATTMFTNITFDNRVNGVPGNNLAVGATEGAFEVNLAGAASYTIPLYMPPGTNGMEPTLSVAYNSMAGDGPMGIGWNIGGLSIISRMSKDMYHDNKTSPVKFETADAFALDGQRLLLFSGNYGTDGAKYRTESESFSQITSMSTEGNGPQWFKVEMKNGLTMEYGNTADARFMEEGASGTSVLLWRINKIYDAYGNYVLFKYKSDLRDSRIDEILYTGNSNTGLTPYNRIKFFYDNRTDVNTTYVNGSSIQTKYLLTSIHVRAENGIARTYEFTYGKDQIDSYLQEITEYGADESKLNSTILKYRGFNSSMTKILSSDLPANSTAGTDLVSGDFNGDGQSDIAYMPYTFTNNVKYNTQLKTYITNNVITSGDPFTETSVTVNLGNDQFVNYKGFDFPPLRQTYTNDFNGDGRDDILFTKQIIQPNGAFHLEKVRMYQPDATGTLSSQHIDIDVDPIFREIPFESQFFSIGDFDGDGRADYIYTLGDKDYVPPTIGPDVQPLKTFLSFPGLNEFEKPLISGQTNDWHKKSIPVDYDGDGKTDLLTIYINPGSHPPSTSYDYCNIRSFYRDANNQINAEILYGSGNFSTDPYPSLDHEIWTGDFNGDRKTDLLTKNASGVWEVAISKGKGNAFSITTFTFNNPYTSGDAITVGDYNGDGMSDIRHYYLTGSGGSQVGKNDIYYSKGNATFYLHQLQVPTDNQGPLNGVNVKGDFNGDGREDVLIRNGQPSDKFRMYFFNEFDRGPLLEKIANGYNHVTTFDYMEMSQLFNYTKGTSSTYPLNDISPSLPLVRQVTVQNGIGGANTISYKYEEARVHLLGRGFLGFKKVISDSKSTDFEHTQRVEQTFELNTTNSKYYVNLPKQQTAKLMKFDLAGNITEETLVSQSTNTWELIELGGLRYWTRISSSESKDLFTGAVSTTVNSYDPLNNGNLTGTSVTMKKGVNVGDEIETATTVFSNYNSNGAWIPNKPGQVQVTRLRTGQPSEVTTSTYSFNTQGSITQQVDFFGLPKAVTTTRQYNNGMGNVTYESMAASGLLTRANTYTYDPKGRYAIQVNNPLNQNSYTEYDPRWGKPIVSTGVDGLVTYCEYDGFGSLKKKKTPEGHEIGTTWTWAVDNTANTYYLVTTVTPGRPTEKVWRDKLNRAVKRHAEGYDGSWVETLTTYDSRGNVKTTTTPHYSGAGATTYVTATNSYDKYNRLLTTVSDFGTTTYGYSGATGQFTATVTAPDGQIRTTVTDAAGKTISVTNFGGTVNYQYDSWGNQVEAKNGTTVLTSMTYDDYGRQTGLVDIDAGTTSYIYNAFGELESQTNANTQTHTMTYDKLGRVLTRVEPASGGTTTYEYYTVGNNGVNQIKKVTNFNGVLEEFTYDTYSRLLTSKYTVDGVAYTTTSGYNVYGDNTTVSYPSGFAILREYNTRGYLTAVKNSNGTKTLFSGNNVDALGNYYNFTLVDGKTSSNTYDKYGFPDLFSTSGVQNLDFNFDIPSGNLLMRNDLIAVKQENFTYNNNRLNTTKINSILIHTINYNGNGNITSKTDAGTYTYHPTKIHAVEKVGSIANYSTLTQDITYTPFQQPSGITENGYNLQYVYGSDYQRIKGTLTQNGSTINTRYYFGDYEIDVTGGITRHIHYIGGGAGLAGIVVRESGVDKYYAVYSDYLGSILKVTELNASNQVVIVASQNFDAWGRPRNPTDWSYTNLPTLPAWLYRGFTGHEHLPQFALINMNGRLYDPVAGRMLSPDNFTQDGLSLQGYNRYSYALNNPLKFTDPDGENPILIIMAIGAVANLAYQGIQGNIHSWGDAGAAVLIGAAAGAVGAWAGAAAVGGYVATSVSTGIIYGAASGAIGGAAGGFVQATGNALYFQRANIGDAIGQGVQGAFWGYVGGAVVGGIVGGITAPRAARYNPNMPDEIGTGPTNGTGGKFGHGEGEGLQMISVEDDVAGQVHSSGATGTTPNGTPLNTFGGQQLAPMPTPEGNIALGLNAGLKRFANAIGAQTYRQFTRGGFQPDEILAAIKNPNNKINFDLTDFSKARYRLFDPSKPVTSGNITNWELHTIYNTPGVLERTTFWKFNGGMYRIVPKPF
ncbi:MAG TPA: FG-GAP-like repeat-containing protein [Saprospiraceae bacterium]|nr:FG-GAP-like repeat-containing protein [Saprospiraceae bacterium]